MLVLGLLAGCATPAGDAPGTANEPATEKPAAEKPAAEPTDKPAAEQPADEKIKIGFANLTDAGDYMVWVKKGMQKAADEAGAELICVDNEADGAKAIENIDTLISAGVDCVIEYMNNSDINTQVKDMLDEVNIPCVAVDIPVVNANGAAAYMGGDNYKAGFICGENLGQAALDKWDGQVDLFISVETMSNGETNTLRNGGILDGIRSKVDVPDSKVVHVDAKDNTAEAQKVVTDALTANQGAKHILIGCHQDDETQGAFAAVEIANRQDEVLLAGCGPFGSTFENLRKPEANFWIGSASFSPEQYGPVAIPLAVALAKGEKVPENSFVTHYFLTQKNINEYYPE
jgi:ribose transport system substrate-binding protein